MPNGDASTSVAIQAQETKRKEAALKVGIKFDFDEQRQVRAVRDLLLENWGC